MNEKIIPVTPTLLQFPELALIRNQFDSPRQGRQGVARRSARAGAYTELMSRVGWVFWTLLALVGAGVLYAWALGVGPWQDPAPIGSQGVAPWVADGEPEESPQPTPHPGPAALGPEGHRAAGVEPIPQATLQGVLLRANPGVDPEHASPAAGVTVTLSAYRSTLTEPLAVQTDEQGRFRFPIPDAKPATVQTMPPTVQSMKVKLRVAGCSQWRDLLHAEDLPWPAPPNREVTLVQYGWDAVHGRVIDVLQNPVADLPLQVISEGRGALPQGESRTVLTGPDGAFRFPAGWVGAIRLKSPEYTLLCDSGESLGEQGQSRPREIIVAAQANLEVLIRDDLGEPAVARNVSVRLSKWESQGARDHVAEGKLGWSVRGKTDEEGRVVFPAVPADQALVVYGPSGPFPRSQSDGALVSEESLAPRLRLSPGETRQTFVTTRALRPIQGRILEPDGKPSPSARFSVFALDPATRTFRDYVRGGLGEADGSFQMTLDVPQGVEQVLLLAQGRIGEVPSLSPFGGSQPPDPLHAGWSLAPWPWEGQPVVIPLRVMQKFGGRVVNEDGQGVSATLRIQPLAQDWIPQRLLSGHPQTTDSDAQGFFSYPAVPEGAYRMTVQAKGYQTLLLPSISPGSQDRIFELESAALARLVLRVKSDAPIREYVYLCTPLTPFEGVDPRAQPLGSTVRVDRPVGWPAEATRVWYGSSSYRGPLGRANFVMRPSAEAEMILEVPPGLYWLGAKAAIEGAGTTFPIGTGLVEVGAGTHTVEFHVRAKGSLAGRVQPFEAHGAEGGQEWHLALAEVGGSVLAVQGVLEPLQSFHELASDGSFALPAVPVGTWELRLGTRAQLESGAAQRRFRVNVSAGENAPIAWWL